MYDNEQELDDEKCCEEPDYQFHEMKIENDGFDNFYQVEYFYCALCGNKRSIAKSIVEDTGE